MTPNYERWYWNPESIVRVQEFFGPAWELPFRAVTLLADSAFVLILVGALFWTRGRRVGYTLLAVAMFGAFVSTLIKFGTDVPRPEHADLIFYETRTSPAFPSGHAVQATATWGLLVYFGIVRVWIAVVIVSLVMLSRVFLGIHYPADLFMGMVVGLLALIFGHFMWARVFTRLTDRHTSTVVSICFILGSIFTAPVASEFPLGWEIVGGLLGAGVGTFIEFRRINYQPVPRASGTQVLRLAIGGAGVVLLLAIGFLVRDAGGGALLRALVMFPMGLWVMLVTPYILVRLGIREAG